MNLPKLTDRKIESDAFHWATDYKPWEEDLDFRHYARHGFEEGQRMLLRELFRKGFLTMEQIQDYPKLKVGTSNGNQ